MTRDWWQINHVSLYLRRGPHCINAHGWPPQFTVEYIPYMGFREYDEIRVKNVTCHDGIDTLLATIDNALVTVARERGLI